MLTNINEESYFQDNIKEAINAIKSNEYGLARKYLYTEMIKNDHSAKVYNLLGVISEHKREKSMACTYYRAAYVFDPTYRPADKNLERVTSFFYIFNEKSIDYGDIIEKEHKKTYLLVYNSMNIGHLRNIETGIRSSY